MEVLIQPMRVRVQERADNYREFFVTPTHWFYKAPFSREALYTEGVSNRLDPDNDNDFWSASDAALRVRHLPAEQLDIREMVLMGTRRSVDYNAPKPWLAAEWVHELDAAWADSATHLHPFAKLPEPQKTDLWDHCGVKTLPLSRPLRYPVQTGVGILASVRPARLHEPWHGGEGTWFPWSALRELDRWPRRQDFESAAAAPDEGSLLLFISHRWESLDHPDPSGRQLEAVRAGLAMALAAAVLGDGDQATASGLPELFGRWLRATAVPLDALRQWAEEVRAAAQSTLTEAELLIRSRQAENDAVRAVCERVLIWYDHASMHQVPRTAEQEQQFRADLQRLNHVQAGAATVVLAQDDDYTRRAWCFLEICGGVRGLMVEITPSWGRSIGAYNSIQRWAFIGDQLIGALVAHGHKAIQGSGLHATHGADLRVVAELLAQLPLFGLVASSASDLIGGAIPLPRREGGWILEAASSPPEVLRDGPPTQVGRLPDVRTLELARMATAETGSLAGRTGVWIYTSQRMLSLAWATRVAEWLEMAGRESFLVDGVACCWADSWGLAENGLGWTGYVASSVDTLVIVTQGDLDNICLLLEFVKGTHLAAGATVVTVMPDTGRVLVQRPGAGAVRPAPVEAAVLRVPRIRRYTAHPRYLLQNPHRTAADLEAMATLRLDPSDSPPPTIDPELLANLGVRRLSVEAKARLWTASWDSYAAPRLKAAAWTDPPAALKQLDLIEEMVDKVASLSDNPYERREVLYSVLEHLKLTGDEPLTGAALDLIDQVAAQAEADDVEE